MVVQAACRARYSRHRSSSSSDPSSSCSCRSLSSSQSVQRCCQPRPRRQSRSAARQQQDRQWPGCHHQGRRAVRTMMSSCEAAVTVSGALSWCLEVVSPGPLLFVCHTSTHARVGYTAQGSLHTPADTALSHVHGKQHNSIVHKHTTCCALTLPLCSSCVRPKQQRCTWRLPEQCMLRECCLGGNIQCHRPNSSTNWQLRIQACFAAVYTEQVHSTTHSLTCLQ